MNFPAPVRADLIADLKAWAEDLGRAPTASEAAQPGAPVSLTKGKYLFGSWQQALEAAGLRTVNEALRAEIAALWTPDATAEEITVVFGISPRALREEIERMREDGWDLPQHTPGELTSV